MGCPCCEKAKKHNEPIVQNQREEEDKMQIRRILTQNRDNIRDVVDKGNIISIIN